MSLLQRFAQSGLFLFKTIALFVGLVFAAVVFSAGRAEAWKNDSATIFSLGPTNTPTNTPTPSPSPFPEYDLTVSQADAPDPVGVGQPLSYTLTVTNSPTALGGSACPNVRFGFPGGVNFTFTSAAGTGGFNAVPDIGGVTFTGGCLTSTGGPASATLTVVITPQSEGELVSLGSRVIVDPENNWLETNETNNTAESIVTTVIKLTPNLSSRADFDGDRKTDFSVFRPADGNWYLDRSAAGETAVNWGLVGDIPVPGDYDGDGKTDIAVFRGDSTGQNPDYFVLNSSDNTISYAFWGSSADTPLIGDWDGDGRSEFTVYRASNNTWYIRQTVTGTVRIINFGANGDVPLYMDYEGDGRSNISVFRPSTGTWYIARPIGIPSQEFYAVQFGISTDMPVPADYDHDNKDDIAVFRPSTGFWYLLRSSDGGIGAKNFGLNGDIPVPGDYDGDGEDDVGVYRNGLWYVDQSTAGFAARSYGLPTDIPIPKRYIP